MTYALELKDLHKSFGKTPIIRGANLAVTAGRLGLTALVRGAHRHRRVVLAAAQGDPRVGDRRVRGRVADPHAHRLLRAIEARVQQRAAHVAAARDADPPLVGDLRAGRERDLLLQRVAPVAAVRPEHGPVRRDVRVRDVRADAREEVLARLAAQREARARRPVLRAGPLDRVHALGGVAAGQQAGDEDQDGGAPFGSGARKQRVQHGGPLAARISVGPHKAIPTRGLRCGIGARWVRNPVKSG